MSSLKLPKVDCKYGAPMGRVSRCTDHLYAGKLHLRQMHLNQGYDNGGAYWGMPSDMWRAWADGAEEEQVMYTRAQTREEAKMVVGAVFPHARFYR
jgi:hypothetical protein